MLILPICCWRLPAKFPPTGFTGAAQRNNLACADKHAPIGLPMFDRRAAREMQSDARGGDDQNRSYTRPCRADHRLCGKRALAGVTASDSAPIYIGSGLAVSG